MNYCVLYPNTSNVNLVKEMGMIPYKLYKTYGYNAWIACYKQGEYSYLEKEVKGLKLEFIDKKRNNYMLDGLAYIRENAMRIDILQIFHITMYSIAYAFLYKKLNPKGKIYLKLDCSQRLVDRLNNSNYFEKLLVKKYLSKVDLVSLELEDLYEELKNLLPINEEKLVVLPNGLDFEHIKELNIEYDFDKKENIVLHVARLGSEEKRSGKLVEEFIKAIKKDASNEDWKLYLVGTIEEGFRDYYEKVTSQDTFLRDRIKLIGPIENRAELYYIYNKAKIFSLSSEFESFGFAFIEAAAFGNVIVSTDVGIAKELTQGKNGAVCGEDQLHTELIKFMKDKDLKKKSCCIREFCMERYDWDKIILKLEQYLSKT